MSRSNLSRIFVQATAFSTPYKDGTTIGEFLDSLGDNVGTDHHSGYYCIPEGLTVEVVENKEMTNWTGLKLRGILQLRGRLVIR